LDHTYKILILNLIFADYDFSKVNKFNMLS